MWLTTYNPTKYTCADFAEKLFKRLERSKEKFEVKLLMMNLISKLIGVHQVRIIYGVNFYLLDVIVCSKLMVYLATYIRMCDYKYTVCFVFFVILFYVGTDLARGYSSGDPRMYICM